MIIILNCRILWRNRLTSIWRVVHLLDQSIAIFKHFHPTHVPLPQGYSPSTNTNLAPKISLSNFKFLENMENFPRIHPLSPTLPLCCIKWLTVLIGTISSPKLIQTVLEVYQHLMDMFVFSELEGGVGYLLCEIFKF